MLSLGDQHLDLLVGDFFLRLAGLAEQPQNGAAGNIEQEDDRRRHFGEDGHRGCGPDGDALRIPQRDLLRHELADNERGIGDEGDDDADADGVGDVLVDAGRDQILRQSLAERGAGKGA